MLGNLFGTPRRVAMGMGEDSVDALREVGKLLAYLKEPEPPKRPEGRLGQAAGAEEGAQHGAQGALAARPARRSSGKARTSISAGCRSRPAGRAMPGR